MKDLQAPRLCFSIGIRYRSHTARNVAIRSLLFSDSSSCYLF